MLYVAEYSTGEKEIMPLNFFQISVTNCKITPEQLRQYLEQAFHKRKHIHDSLAKLIIANPKNYNFKRNVITNLGKLCDVMVDEETFREVLSKIKSISKK